VSYAGSGGFAWIITRIEKKSSGNKYIVRDDYAEESEFDTYSVESNRIAPFPAPSEDFKIGDRVLALWKDEEAGEWSTMLYDAEITKISSDHRVTLLYRESDSPIDVDVNRITKYPLDFDLYHKMEEQRAEDKTPSIGSHATTSDSATEPLPVRDSHGGSTSDDGSEFQKGDGQVKKTLSAHTEDQEKRRLQFMFTKPAESKKPELQCLSNEDFGELAGPPKEIRRMRTEFGTPLLDRLADADLFVQNQITHVTGSGVISVPGIEPPKGSSALLRGPVRCGRLGWIMNEWRSPHK
jgi:hypothetical protein